MRLGWLPWRLAKSNRAALDRLVEAGPLTDEDARYFVALCRGGHKTPDWLVEKLIASADTAKGRE